MKLMIILFITLSLPCHAETKNGTNYKCKNPSKAIENFKSQCFGAVWNNERLGANNKPKDFPDKYCRCIAQKFAVEAVADEKCDYWNTNLNNQIFNQKAKEVCNY